MLISTVVVAMSLAMFQAPPPSSEDLDTAFAALKSAEGKKDLDEIKKCAIESSKIAKAIIKLPSSAAKSDPDGAKALMEHAKEIDKYADYSLYTAGLAATDKAKQLELFDALLAQSPKGEYTPKMIPTYIATLNATGKQAKIVPFAEKAIAGDPTNEDLLLVLSNSFFTRKSWAQAATYGSRLAAASKQPSMIGRGYYFAGMANAQLNKHSQADKALRAALPNIKSETALYGPALFQLGLSDYNMAHVTHDRVMLRDAVNFSEECSKMNSPVAGQCAQNAFAMKKELAAFR